MKRWHQFQRQGEGGASGFSLIEITLAMAIAAVAMVSILGMLPQAMKYARDSADETAIGAVMEDVHDRIKGTVLAEGDVLGSPFFYDQQGRFWTDAQKRPDTLGEERFFRVDVSLRKPEAPNGVTFPVGMMAAVLQLSWPLNGNGEAVGEANPKTTVTYMVTTLSGPDWKVIDPAYLPKLEY